MGDCYRDCKLEPCQRAIFLRQVVTMTRLRVIIVTVWFVSAAYCSPRLVMYGTVEAVVDDTREALCVLQRALYDSKTYDLVNFVVCFLVPLIIISVLYAIICYQLWHSQGIVSRPQNHIQSNSHHPPAPTLPEKADQPPCSPDRCASCSDSDSTPPLKRLEFAQTLVTTTTKAKDNVSTMTLTLPYIGPGQVCSEEVPLSRQSSCLRCSQPGTPPRKQTPKTFYYSNNAAASALRPRRKVIRLLVAVVLSFALCNLPFHARKLWQHWSKEYNGSSPGAAILTVVTNLVLYLNSGINPFLYALFSKNFRQYMADVIFCRGYRRRFKSRSSFRAMSKSINSVASQGQQAHQLHPVRQATLQHL